MFPASSAVPRSVLLGSNVASHWLLNGLWQAANPPPPCLHFFSQQPVKEASERLVQMAESTNTLQHPYWGRTTRKPQRAHTHRLHAGTHTHTQTHTHKSSLLHAFSLSLLKAQIFTCTQHSPNYVDGGTFHLYKLITCCSSSLQSLLWFLSVLQLLNLLQCIDPI